MRFCIIFAYACVLVIFVLPSRAWADYSLSHKDKDYDDMDIMSLREYCLSLPLCTEDMPFDDVTLCFRLAGKIFALTSLDNPTPAVNLKCQPELAIELRTHYEGIQPGFHMSKRHWNTVLLDEVPTALIKDLICNSYALILSALPRQKRSEKPLADFVAPKIQF